LLGITGLIVYHKSGQQVGIYDISLSHPVNAYHNSNHEERLPSSNTITGHELRNLKGYSDIWLATAWGNDAPK
jgi:hypothetical protein